MTHEELLAGVRAICPEVKIIGESQSEGRYEIWMSANYVVTVKVLRVDKQTQIILYGDTWDPSATDYQCFITLPQAAVWVARRLEEEKP